ncbi:amidase domain-containing protein [Halalkalibacter sp. APA_J-10(15)]|uniref:amidase domain-containing protein n=1 Tax=Halalkalibacter sp. APA_J-10(15) TaxID=2933805 RepID=UPI001FF64B14|nr:amidase domain-containing protein [Halalkalibacter sp. APA_J-10(15)]MCK0470428.1 amidase domain-containing protein [Halalkalibacter sp. APA_J-10(15)]
MDERIILNLHQRIKNRSHAYVSNIEKTDQQVENVLSMHRQRGATIVRTLVEGDVLRSNQFDDQQIVDYVQHEEFLIKLKDEFYVEERECVRRATFLRETCQSDHQIGFEGKLSENDETAHVEFSHEESEESIQRATYDRRKAVQYAERWWNDYNPQYEKFENNCTNFISQCLRAGGAEMRGFSNRSKGWWYNGRTWSYSWSVANAMRWYLSGANSGLRGEERARAELLEPGDVICYDFNGNGSWQHTTIVVAKDANGEPLVNAQTTNSRMRYWKYEDSTAWTPQIQYKFFHIKI